MRDFLFGSDGDRCPMVAALRIFCGVGMLTHGVPKLYAGGQFLPGFDKLTAMVASQHLPAPAFLALMAIMAESLCAALLAIGLFTRLSAFILTINMTVAAFMVHSGASFAERELALFYLFTAMLYLFKGAGRWSLDTLIN